MKKRKKQDEAPVSSVDRVFERHRKAAKLAQFKKARLRIFFAAIATGFLLIFGIYLSSDRSKISGIRISGNRWLSDDAILELIGINENSRSLFLFESLLQRAARQHPLIESITVHENAAGVVEITVTEKGLVGYRYLDKPEILTKEGELIEMSDDLSFLLNRLPLIVGFDGALEAEEEEEGELPLIQQLAKAMKNVDAEKIEMISEIHQVAFSYDDRAILCIMQDGNEVYGSFYSIDMLNSYNQVASALPQKKNCIYIDEMTGNPYTSLCPEELAEKEKEEAENSAEEGQETPQSEEKTEE